MPADGSVGIPTKTTASGRSGWDEAGVSAEVRAAALGAAHEALRGLSHREIGDATDAISLLLEAPEPFLDATRGRTNRALLLSGKDEFVVRAGRRGLLFEKIDEKGWPIDVRVGRHTSTVLQLLEIWSADHADKAVEVSGVPRYGEVVEKGTGAFLKDPKTIDPAKVVYE